MLDCVVCRPVIDALFISNHRLHSPAAYCQGAKIGQINKICDIIIENNNDINKLHKLQILI